jgi:hypothetical protein
MHGLIHASMTQATTGASGEYPLFPMKPSRKRPTTIPVELNVQQCPAAVPATR